jgi:YVTN family beta-propeller protein
VAVNPNTNRIYVANYGSNNVSIIDGASNTVVAAVALAVGNYPWAVAINPNTNLIYVANGGYTSNNVSVIDGASDTIVATVAGGSWPDGVAVNANTNRIYVANSADDTISVIEDIVPATPTDTFTPTPHPATPTPPHPPSVGGKVMLPPAAIAAESPGSAEDSWWSAGAYAALAVGLGAAAAAVGATAWYAKRRWQR